MFRIFYYYYVNMYRGQLFLWQGPPFVRDLIEVVPDTGDIRVLSRIDRETVDWLNLTGTPFAIKICHIVIMVTFVRPRSKTFYLHLGAKLAFICADLILFATFFKEFLLTILLHQRYSISWYYSHPF